MLKTKLLLFILLAPLFQITAEPLQGKTRGVEFNIPRVIAYDDDWKTLSGTYSIFDHKNQAEIAFPWFAAKYGSGDNALYNQSIDIHYRKFIEDRLGGPYLSAFARLSNFDGKAYVSSNDLSGDRETENKNALRFGLGVGIGTRIFPNNKNMYWGASLSIGRYFDTSEDFTEDTPDLFGDTSFILDVELLKFGYAF